MLSDNLYICPNDNSKLFFDESKEYLICNSCKKQYKNSNGVIIFLEKSDTFYEGTYLNHVKYIPKKEKWYYIWPLRLISNGYVWEVRKQVSAGSRVLELGCAGGVKYFSNRYRMIGADISLSSLLMIKDLYETCIQVDATKTLPLKDNSIDAIISSYFWEHISEPDKIAILKECKRILVPGGKLIFIYDVATENKLIKRIKNKSIDLYNKLFIEKDGHIGYHSPAKNKEIFEKAGFTVTKHFGMERTWLQSQSVYTKLLQVGGPMSAFGKIMLFWGKRGILFVYMAKLLLFDHTIGKLFSISKSRIMLTVAQKNV